MNLRMNVVMLAEEIQNRPAKKAFFAGRKYVTRTLAPFLMKNELLRRNTGITVFDPSISNTGRSPTTPTVAAVGIWVRLISKSELTSRHSLVYVGKMHKVPLVFLMHFVYNRLGAVFMHELSFITP